MIELLLLIVAIVMYMGHPWFIVRPDGEIEYPLKRWRW